jgi:hypothetical protein
VADAVDRRLTAGRRRPSWTIVIARMALLTASLVCGVFAAEVAARRLLAGVASAGDQRTYLAAKLPHARKNRLGYRERDFGSKTGYRIVVTGDSFTWGAGIREADRFSNLVGSALGEDYEVLNFGYPGRDLPEHVKALDQVLGLSPDFILAQLFINDWEVRPMVRPEPLPIVPSRDLERQLRRSSILYDLLDEQWAHLQVASGMVESYPDYMARHLRDPQSPASRKTTDLLQRLVQRASAADVPVGIVLFPTPDSLDQPGPFQYLHDRVNAVCEEQRITCLDLQRPLAACFSDARSMWVNRFDHHPSAEANRCAAVSILQRFTPGWRRDRARRASSLRRTAG